VEGEECRAVDLGDTRDLVTHELGVTVDDKVGDAATVSRVEAPQESLVLSHVVSVVGVVTKPSASQKDRGEGTAEGVIGRNHKQSKAATAATESTRRGTVVILGATVVEEDVVAQGDHGWGSGERDSTEEGGRRGGGGGRRTTKVGLSLFHTRAVIKVGLSLCDARAVGRGEGRGGRRRERKVVVGAQGGQGSGGGEA